MWDAHKKEPEPACGQAFIFTSETPAWMNVRSVWKSSAGSQDSKAETLHWGETL